MSETYLNLAGLTQYDKKIKEVIQKDLASAFSTSSSYSAGAYVVYNGLLYKANTNTSGSWDPTKWTQVQVTNLINDLEDAIDDAIPKSLLENKGDLIVAAMNPYLTITTLPVGSNGQVLTADSNQAAGIKWATPAPISDATITIQKNGTTVNTFTLNGSDTTVNITDVASASTLLTATGNISTLQGQVAWIDSVIPDDTDPDTNQLADKAWVTTQVRTNASHFRGSFNTWSDVPTSASGYLADETTSTTPTVNDYIIVDDASDYDGTMPTGVSTLEGTWRFTYTGVWSTLGKTGWYPAYQVEPATSFKTINGNSIIGSGNIVTPNYYHTPSYSSGLSIATGTGVNALYVPNATDSLAGVVSTGAQTFAGAKTFSSTPLFTSGASYKQGTTSTYAKLVGNSSASAATTITLPATSGTLVISSDLPQVTFSTTTLSGGTTIRGLTVGNDKYNFYVPTSISAATTTVLGSVKLGIASAGSAAKTYPVGFNSNQQMYVDVPWTDNNTATAANNILAGSNSGTQITYAPYSGVDSTWVNTESNGGKLYSGTENPAQSTRLNYNGHLHATNLYEGSNRVLTSASTYVTDVKINNVSVVSSKVANISLTATQTSSSSSPGTSTNPQVTTTIGYGSSTPVQFISITDSQINGLFTATS